MMISILRISVDGGGCQGFSYKFDFDNKIKADDKIINFDTIKVVIDQNLSGLYQWFKIRIC